MKTENASKWKVIGLDSKQVNALRELHRSQAKGIICQKYRKEYLEIIRKLRQDYIDEQNRKIFKDKKTIMEVENVNF